MRFYLVIFAFIASIVCFQGSAFADEILKDKSIVKIEIFDGPNGELHGVYTDAKTMYILDAHSKSGLKILSIFENATGDMKQRFCITVKKDMIKKVTLFQNGLCK